MPIEQHRLFRLIQAARTYQHRFERLYRLCEKLDHEVHNTREISAAQAMRAIHDQLIVFPLYSKADEIVATETVRYNLTHRHNANTRFQLRAKRARSDKSIRHIPIPPDRIPEHTDPDFADMRRPELEPEVEPAIDIEFEQQLERDPELRRAMKIIHDRAAAQDEAKGIRRKGATPDSEITSPPEPDLDDKDLDL